MQIIHRQMDNLNTFRTLVEFEVRLVFTKAAIRPHFQAATCVPNLHVIEEYILLGYDAV
jgi:hypothetical protein